MGTTTTAESPYERLAEALDRLPNAYPRTASGIEIRLLEKICTPEEAGLAAVLTGTPEPVDAIAARVGRPPGEVGRALVALVRRGLAWLEAGDGHPRFRLAPFLVGLWEAQLDVLDHELAHLAEQYFLEGGLMGILGPRPALMRVVPAQGTPPPEQILPYDEVRTLLGGMRTFSVRDCICRVQQAELGAPCEYPTRVCLSFSERDRPARPGDLTPSEALALLDLTEQVGLVHCVSNVAEGAGFVCNCCGCCCGLLRGITELGIDASVASANYVASIDAELCAACGTCIDRCQVGAISEHDGASVVDPARCIGCGLCVTGCPNDVARLERRPAAETVDPPRDYAAWELERLRDRGLLPAGSAGT